ncbi:MAG: DUF2017 domain-containing protein [Marmoricola sp.]
MKPGFRRHRKSGRALATFSAFEADLLRSLAAQLIELLRHEMAVTDHGDPLEAMLDFAGPTTPPDDPVLARLFPSAYSDDDEAAGEFRRYTEISLRDSKASAAATVVDTLEEAGLPDVPEDGQVIDVELDESTAWVWLRAFTDMRLAIASRLGIDSDPDAEELAFLGEDDPRSQVFEIYQWVGFLQETLVDAAS